MYVVVNSMPERKKSPAKTKKLFAIIIIHFKAISKTRSRTNRTRKTWKRTKIKPQTQKRYRSPYIVVALYYHK